MICTSKWRCPGCSLAAYAHRGEGVDAGVVDALASQGALQGIGLAAQRVVESRGKARLLRYRVDQRY